MATMLNYDACPSSDPERFLQTSKYKSLRCGGTVVPLVSLKPTLLMHTLRYHPEV